MTQKVKLTQDKIKTRKLSALIMGGIVAVVIILQVLHDGISNLLMLLPVGIK